MERDYLYAKPFISIPFAILFHTETPTLSVLRIFARYVETAYASQPVHRCPLHLASDGVFFCLYLLMLWFFTIKNTFLPICIVYYFSHFNLFFQSFPITILFQQFVLESISLWLIFLKQYMSVDRAHFPSPML